MTLTTRIHRAPVRYPAARSFDRMVDDFFEGFGLMPGAFGPPRPLPRPLRAFGPRVDVVEDELVYRVTAELPGVEAEDIHVIVEDGVLMLEVGPRQEPEAAEAGSETGATPARAPRYRREIRFPGEIVETNVRAVYRNGLLSVTVPKLAAVEPEIRSIPVETA